jgi:hypothetical protein
MMGKAFGTEFRESQFMPTLEISKDLADELASAEFLDSHQITMVLLS